MLLHSDERLVCLRTPFHILPLHSALQRTQTSTAFPANTLENRQHASVCACVHWLHTGSTLELAGRRVGMRAR